MCGSRHTFSRTETKYFVGATEIPANQLREIPGYRFAELFPHRRDGFTLKYGVKPVHIPDRDRIPVAQQKEDHLATLGHWKHRRVERGEMTEAQYAAEMAAAEKNWSPSSAFAYLVTNATPPQAIDRVIKWERKEKQTMCGAKCRNARGPNCDCICEGKYHGAGMTNSRTRFAASDLDFKPTAEMAANAARGLELREKHGKGGTAVGVARARDIKNRANLSPDTVKRMHSFFSRHEGNQAGGEDDAGYIAWLLWGGDAGKAWAARKAAQIDKSESARGAARKATMARDRDVKVRKGNFTDTVAIVGQNGNESADWYAGLILRHKDGEEQVLWMKHNYKTEAAATKYAIQKFDAHVGRGGYSRPGAKERFEQLQVGDAFRFENRIYVVNSNAAEVNALLASDKRDSEKAMMLAGYLYKRWLSYEGKANASRPGAKSKFDRMAVANEILRQLGGGRFMAMVGGKNALATTVNGKNGLQVQIGRGAKNGINRLVVLLDEGSDTYDMQLWRIGQRGLSTTKVWEGDGLYAEDLARIFTDKTGFYTSFARPGAKARFNKPNTVTVVTVMSGTGGSGGLFKVVGYDENGREYEYGLFAMRSIAEEKAKQIARYKDWSFNASRPGAKAKMAATPHKITYTDKSGVTHTYMVSDKILRAMNGTKKYAESVGSKPDYASVLRLGERTGEVIRASRPGAKARFNLTGNELYNRVIDTIHDMQQFVSLSVPRMKAAIDETAKYAKRCAATGERILKDNIASPEALRELDRAASVARASWAWRISGRGSFSRPGAKARFYTPPVKTGKNGPVTWDNLFVGHLGNGWTLANKGHEVSGDYERVANIAYGGEVTFAPGFNQARLDPRVKAYIQKLSVEAAQKKSAGEPLARTGSGQGLYSRARFANWETNLTKKYGKPIEEHTAKIGRNSWKIEVAEAMDGSVVANLFLWNDNRGFEHFESGSLQGLRNLAERTSRSDAASIAKINRIANYARPGAKARFGIAEHELRDGSIHLDFAAFRQYIAGKNETELRYMAKDAAEALRAYPDGKKANYYADMVNEVGDELRRRSNKMPLKSKSNGLTLAQRIAVAHDAKRMALR